MIDKTHVWDYFNNLNKSFFNLKLILLQITFFIL